MGGLGFALLKFGSVARPAEGGKGSGPVAPPPSGESEFSRPLATGESPGSCGAEARAGDVELDSPFEVPVTDGKFSKLDLGPEAGAVAIVATDPGGARNPENLSAPELDSRWGG